MKKWNHYQLKKIALGYFNPFEFVVFIWVFLFVVLFLFFYFHFFKNLFF